MFVTISKHQENKNHSDKWDNLTIGGKPIAFLQQPLLNQFEGKVNRADKATFWYLEFFKNTEYKIELFVSFHTEKPEKIKCISKAIWQEASSGRPSQEQVEIASRWLRGSSTLRLKDYEDRGDLLWSFDGTGFSMFSDDIQYPRFERAVLLLALACAYRLRLQALINELADWDNDPLRLTKLVRRATEFNARCYFRHPVLMDRTELPYVWDRMAERMRLQAINEELLDQLRSLHELIAADERERVAQERERARDEMERARHKETIRWQRVGLAIGVISLIQVVSLLPESIRDPWVIKILNWIGIVL